MRIVIGRWDTPAPILPGYSPLSFRMSLLVTNGLNRHHLAKRDSNVKSCPVRAGRARSHAPCQPCLSQHLASTVVQRFSVRRAHRTSCMVHREKKVPPQLGSAVQPLPSTFPFSPAFSLSQLGLDQAQSEPKQRSTCNQNWPLALVKPQEAAGVTRWKESSHEKRRLAVSLRRRSGLGMTQLQALPSY